MIESRLYVVFFTVLGRVAWLHLTEFVREEGVHDICFVLFLSVDLSILI